MIEAVRPIALGDIEEARERIAGTVLRTPLVRLDLGPGGGKALLIEKPTVNGEVSPFPLAINTLGSERRMAMSLGTASIDQAAAELGSLVKARPPASFKEAIKLLGTALDLRHAKPKLVKTGPCKEVIKKFDAGSKSVESWPKAPDWRMPSMLDPRPPIWDLGEIIAPQFLLLFEAEWAMIG